MKEFLHILSLLISPLLLFLSGKFLSGAACLLLVVVSRRSRSRRHMGGGGATTTFFAWPSAALAATRPDLLELPQHLVRLGPDRRRRVDAVQRELQRVHELLVRGRPRGGVAHQLQVEHLAGPLLLHDGRHPLRQVHAVGAVRGGLARQQLQDDDA
uniref:Uncharacterized protein n=1 Tax=Zea mays TaxID=4577 RepID=A0A804NY65_MAIZE